MPQFPHAPNAPLPSGPHDPLDAAFVALIAVVAAWTWVAIVLAEVGWFTRGALLGLALPASVGAGWRAFASVTPRRPMSGLDAAGAGLVLLLAALPFVRPAEPLVDGNDASVYLNAGRSLARYGALAHPKPLLSLIPSEDWGAVLDRELSPPRVFNVFPGGTQVVPGVNEVRPGFFHLLPVWIGSAELIAGPRAAYIVPPLSGLLALIAFWMLARTLTSVVPATLATALLASNVAMQWFSRVTMTEVAAAALILAGLTFAVWFARQPSQLAGVLAGTSIGLAAFARVDVLLFVIPVVAAFTAFQAIDRPGAREWRWLAAALVLVTAHAVVHAWLFADLYTERIAFHLLRARSVTTASRVIPPIVLVLGIGAWLLSRRAHARWLGRAVGVGFGVALLVAAARIGPALTGGALSLLFTPAGTALIVVSMAFWATTDRSSPVLLVAGLWLTAMLVYAESARDVGVAPWILRRYVPVLLPLSVLALAAVADRSWRRGGLWRVAAVLVLGGLSAVWASDAIPVLRADALSGLHAQLDRIAHTLPDDAVVLTDVTTPSHFGLSLYGSFGRSVLFVMPSMHTARVLDALADRLAIDGRPLILAVAPDADDARGLAAQDLAGLELSAARVESMSVVTLEAVKDQLPRARVVNDRPIAFHDVRRRPAAVAPVTFEVGENDLGVRGIGFHGVELMGASYARWSSAVATLYLPRVAPIAAGRLLIRVAAPRPASIAPPILALRLDGRPLGQVGPLEPGFTVFAVPLEPWALDAVARGGAMVAVASPTFSPADDGTSTDRRQLGAAIDWVRIEPQ
jgi:hypothetical protein